MSLFNDLAQTIVDIIDSKGNFKIIRRPYDEDFAKAHGITLQHITDKVMIPCLFCGEDISRRVLLQARGQKPIVYCGPVCRGRHGAIRMLKLNDATDINATAKMLIERGYTIEMKTEAAVSRPRAARVTLLAAMNQTNKILTDILKELRDARKA